MTDQAHAQSKQPAASNQGRRRACTNPPTGVSARARPHLVRIVRRLRRDLDECETLVVQGIDVAERLDGVEEVVCALLRATRRG
jgi:hypothetical protein